MHTFTLSINFRAYNSASIRARASMSILSHTSVCLFVRARASASIRSRASTSIHACGGYSTCMYIVLSNIIPSSVIASNISKTPTSLSAKFWSMRSPWTLFGQHRRFLMRDPTYNSFAASAKTQFATQRLLSLTTALLSGSYFYWWKNRQVALFFTPADSILCLRAINWLHDSPLSSRSFCRTKKTLLRTLLRHINVTTWGKELNIKEVSM